MCRGAERGAGKRKGGKAERGCSFQRWEHFPLNHSVTLSWIPPSAFSLHGSLLSPVFPEMAPEEEFFPASRKEKKKKEEK